MRLVLALACLAACQSSDVSRSLGARCDTNADCDQKCLASADYPGGFCTTVCDNDNACSSDALCASESGGVCLFKCTLDPDCAFLGAGYTCQMVDANVGGAKVLACRG